MKRRFMEGHDVSRIPRAILEITILGTLAVLIVFALYQGMNP